MPDESSPNPRILSRARSDPSRWPAVADELEPALVNVREPVAVIRRHLRLFLGITLAVTAVVAYFAYTATPSYRAVAVIRFSDPRRALTGGVADGPGGQGGGAVDPVQSLLSQVELLKSRTVAGVVVDSMPILRVRTHDFPASILTDLAVAPDQGVDSLELTFGSESLMVHAVRGGTSTRVAYGDAVQVDGIRFRITERPVAERGSLRVMSRGVGSSRLVGGLRVALRPRTDVIDVAYTASDPYRAQQVVNQIVQVFRAVSAEEVQRQSRLRREFLEAQLKINDSVLGDARNALTVFRRRAGRVGPGEVPARQQGAGAQLEREQLDGDRRMYRGLLASLDSTRGGGSREALRAAMAAPGIAGSVVVGQLYNQLAQYETVRDSLAARSPAHPDLPRTRELIAGTEAKLLAAVQTTAQGLITALDSRIAALDAERARLATTADQLSATDAQEASLVERVENARQIADQLRLEYQRARIAEAVEVGQVEIVDLAVVPNVPVGIGFTATVALGLLLGLVLGGGSAFMADHLRSAIGRREDIEALGMPLLSAVPRCRQNGHSKTAQGTEAAVEAIRGLRLNLVHVHGTAGPVVFAVTSPGSRDGKSFVASNLALAFAQANYRTLLIDGDGRRGTLHRVLKGAVRMPGLTDALGGDVPPSDVIQSTSYRSLYFIGCGRRRSDGPELLSSERMAELFAFLRSNFTAIIVDTPPLAAGVDAFALATAAGNLVMVLRSGLADRDLVEAKLDLLHRLPVRILGAVLNNVREGPEFRGYSYYLEGYEAKDEPVERQRPVLRTPR